MSSLIRKTRIRGALQLMLFISPFFIPSKNAAAAISGSLKPAYQEKKEKIPAKNSTNEKKKEVPSSVSEEAGKPEELDVLLLPVFEAELVDPKSDGFKVGDLLTLRIKEFFKEESLENESSSFQVETFPGSSTLEELGWARLGVTRKGSDLLVQLAPLKSGESDLPILGIRKAEDSDQGKWVGRTQLKDLSVESAIADGDPNPQEQEPPEPPVGLPFPLVVVVLAVALALILALILVLFVFRLVRKRSQIEPVALADPIIPEDQEALQALISLENSDLLQNGKIKTYYFGVSEVLKRYLGRRYGFDALEATSFEVMEFFRSASGLLSKDQIHQLEQLFETLDLVKFTDFIPSAQEPQDVTQATRNLIERTKRRLETSLLDESRKQEKHHAIQ